MNEVLVMDIGGTSIKYALMNSDYEMLTHGRLKIKNTTLDDLIDNIVEVAQLHSGRFKAVSVSMPGRIDMEKGIAHSGGVFEFLVDIPFAKLISDRIGVPVFIANDANCAGRAELDLGALKGVKGGAVLVTGSSIGGAVVIDGKIWIGHTFAAGEAAWLPINLADIYGVKYTNANRAEGFSGSICSVMGLVNLYAEKKGQELPYDANGGKKMMEAYDAGEAEAKEALEEHAMFFAAEIFSIQAFLDLERFAIGGGITAHPAYLEHIRRSVDMLYAKYPKASVRKPEVVCCKFGSDANLIGAMSFYLDNEK